MNTKLTLNRRLVLGLPVCLFAMGGGCPAGGPFPGTADSVAVVFVNRAGFEVDPTVEGERMATVLPGITTRAILFDCSPDQRYVFSGSVRTNTQTLPSPYWFTFYDGINTNCGETIEITYFMNADNDLDLDGVSY